MATSKTPSTSKSSSPAGRNEPLLRDIRLLWRILGDVIREQEGKEAFDLIERIRQLAVAYRSKRDDQAGLRNPRLHQLLLFDHPHPRNRCTQHRLAPFFAQSQSAH